MRRIRWLLMACALATACVDRTPRPRSIDSAVSGSVAPPPDTMRRLLNRSAWVASEGALDPFGAERSDRGLGVYRITSEAMVLDDSLVFHSAPSRLAPPLAVIRMDTAPEGWRVLRFLAADSITANLAEFRYETVGIPLDSVTPDRQWAHVIFGFAPGGRPRAGWVAIADSSRVEWWGDLLLEFTNLAADSSLRVFERPDDPAGGQRPPWKSHDIRAVAVEGDWMRVSIKVPGDYCEKPAPDSTTHVRWIRWRDASRRPLLWYAPRGC